MRRLFVAIDLDDHVLERLAKLRDDLDAGFDDHVRIKWTKPPQMHVTLKFLGDTEDDAIEPLADALDEIAHRHGPFEIRAEGVGCFPRPDRPRILWVGFDDESVASLQALHHEIDTEFEACGIPPDDRTFVPHATIGRVKSDAKPHLNDILGDVDRSNFGTSRVDEIRLYESHLGPDGATHKIVDRFHLGS